MITRKTLVIFFEQGAHLSYRLFAGEEDGRIMWVFLVHKRVSFHVNQAAS
jgi:hypothetical protein